MIKNIRDFICISKSKLFDWEYYLRNNRDVLVTGVSPLWHFVKHGFREKRMPHPAFDIKHYEDAYRSVILSGENPLVHYCKKGWRMGYQPNRWFDTSYYLSNNSDVKSSGMNPLAHFLYYGYREKRLPNKNFVWNDLLVAQADSGWEQFCCSVNNTLQVRDITEKINQPRFALRRLLINKIRKIHTLCGKMSHNASVQFLCLLVIMLRYTFKFLFLSHYRKAVVLYRPYGVGDLLMGIPAFVALRKKFPNRVLILYVAEESERLMRSTQIFDELIVLPRTKFLALLSTVFKKFIPRPLSGQYYNLLNELQFVASKRGFNTANGANYLHRADDFAQKLNVEIKNYQYSDLKTNSEQLWVRQKFWWAGIDLAKDCIIVVTFEATNPLRAWDKKKYSQLLLALTNQGFKVVIVGNRDDYLGIDFSNERRIVDLRQQTPDLIYVWEIVKMAKLVISVDTFLYHMAGLLGVPSIVLFTGGVMPSARVQHYSNCRAVVADIDCWCWEMGCRNKKIDEVACINKLDIEKIKIALKELQVVNEIDIAIVKASKENNQVNPIKVIVLYVAYEGLYKEAFINLVRLWSKIEGCYVDFVYIENNENYYTENTFCGDNSVQEFSAWDKYCRENKEKLSQYDIINCVTSAFLQPYNRYLEKINRTILRILTKNDMLVGHIDCYDERVEYRQMQSNAWIRTGFFLFSPKVLPRVLPFAKESKYEELFSDNFRQPFTENNIISTNYQKNIFDWLTGNALQGCSWHSHVALTEDNWDYFRRKALCIINEHAFSIIAQKKGIHLADITWLWSRTLNPEWVYHKENVTIQIDERKIVIGHEENDKRHEDDFVRDYKADLLEIGDIWFIGYEYDETIVSEVRNNFPLNRVQAIATENEFDFTPFSQFSRQVFVLKHSEIINELALSLKRQGVVGLLIGDLRLLRSIIPGIRYYHMSSDYDLQTVLSKVNNERAECF